MRSRGCPTRGPTRVHRRTRRQALSTPTAVAQPREECTELAQHGRLSIQRIEASLLAVRCAGGVVQGAAGAAVRAVVPASGCDGGLTEVQVCAPCKWL